MGVVKGLTGEVAPQLLWGDALYAEMKRSSPAGLRVEEVPQAEGAKALG